MLTPQISWLTTPIEAATEGYDIAIEIAQPAAGSRSGSLPPHPLIAAGDNPSRLRSEATWAKLGGATPLEASSGQVTRHHRNRGGARQANHALWRIVLTRMSCHAPTKIFLARRTAEGTSQREIMRVLTRYVAREIYHYLPRE